jgi:hypothetical protein
MIAGWGMSGSAAFATSPGQPGPSGYRSIPVLPGKIPEQFSQMSGTASEIFPAHLYDLLI